jgi:hypothetical protein
LALARILTAGYFFVASATVPGYLARTRVALQRLVIGGVVLSFGGLCFTMCTMCSHMFDNVSPADVELGKQLLERHRLEGKTTDELLRQRLIEDELERRALEANQ